MKRFAKVTAAALVLVLLLGCLTACSSLSEEESAAVGKYQLTSLMGIAYGGEDSYLELKDNGRAELYIDGEGGTYKWSLEDGALTISGSDGDLTGTVEGDVIVIDMGGTPAVFER